MQPSCYCCTGNQSSGKGSPPNEILIGIRYNSYYLNLSILPMSKLVRFPCVKQMHISRCTPGHITPYHNTSAYLSTWASPHDTHVGASIPSAPAATSSSSWPRARGCCTAAASTSILTMILSHWPAASQAASAVALTVLGSATVTTHGQSTGRWWWSARWVLGRGHVYQGDL